MVFSFEQNGRETGKIIEKTKKKLIFIKKKKY